jgi:hypothetical protein
MLTVITPADTYDLTILATAKADLGITGSSGDAYLQSLIQQASGEIAAFCDRVFALETVSETFAAGGAWWRGRPSRCAPLALARWPVVEITSVTEDDTLVSADDYTLDAAEGLLYRTVSAIDVGWWGGDTVVVYSGGYALLGELPFDIERCCLDLVRQWYHGRSRDPALRSEEVPGVISQSWSAIDSLPTVGGIPADIAGRLNRYKRAYV